MQFLMQYFEIILTLAVIVCFIFYLIDGRSYRKERNHLLKCFKEKTETDQDRQAYQARLAQVDILPATVAALAVKDPEAALAKVKPKVAARYRLKSGILQKLQDKTPLSGEDFFWLKQPVYPREKFIEFFSGMFWVLFLVWGFRSFLWEPFKIPSGSMEPTLYAGDFILTQKYRYGIKLPLLNKTIIPLGKVQRGDVIVFRYPPDERLNYIKRVIGLPGDRLRFDHGKVWINGKEQSWSAADTPANTTADKKILTEHLEGHAHPVQIYPDSRIPWRGTVIVPEKHYFVMGDNRDNSADSRRWGFVPEENIVGKASRIWMNSNCILGNGGCNRIGQSIR